MRSLTKLFVAAVLLMCSVHLALPSPPAAQEASGNSSAVPHGASLATVQAACPGAQEHSLPLPTSVPPGEFVDYEKKVLKFLQNGEYTKWCVDKSMRDTGPYLHAVYKGTHPAVRIYYSPKVMEWLAKGRPENIPIPDGAMIVKEQYTPAASQHTGDDKPWDWTIMIKDSKGAKDGWFWGEFFWDPDKGGLKMTFDDDKPPFQYPWAGFGIYCVRCHASAEREMTFSALNNIQGFPGEPLKFEDDHLRTLTPSALEGRIFLTALTPGRKADPDFLRTFNSIPGVPFASVQKMLSETYDNIPQPGAGPAQFISSSQCESCHGALTGPFGPTMFLPASPAPAATSGANVSPYGEWRWSPMGLAGRDPVFFAQLESEFAYLKTRPDGERLTRDVRNACLQCHGAMGKRQLDVDSGAAAGDFQLSFLQITDRRDSHFKYGALARDGISCQVCHRNAPNQYPPGQTPLEYFLEHSITGQFPVSKPEELYGPFKDNEISPYIMETATNIKPVEKPYIQSSRMCGSCHTIVLPVLDSPEKGKTSIEQATYLEWLNSQYQTEFTPGPNAKSCGDCHMPTEYHGKGIDVPQIQQRMAIVEDETYPEAEHRAPNDKITVRVRKEGFRRHEFLGLNVFLLQMFDQFWDVLGVRKPDYMSGSTTDLQDTVDHFVQQAQSTTAAVKTSATVTGAHQIQADVAITNLTGHRFPSGVGFRRAFIELLVTDKKGKIVWASGRTNGLGVILDGKGKALPSEFLAEYTDSHGKKKQHYQPHYEVITAQDQVQIYEELNRDASGKFTTNFTLRDEPVKDNRLLPIGWTSQGPDPSLNGIFLHATHPEGTAVKDPDYQDGKGTDHITYKASLPPDVDATKCSVQATLYYQSMPPYYLAQRFAEAPNGEATRRLYYLTSNLNLNWKPVSKDWKLKIVSTSAAVTTKQASPAQERRVCPAIEQKYSHCNVKHPA